MGSETWTLLGNTPQAWLSGLAIAAALTVTARLVVYVVIRRLRHLADRTKTSVDDLIVGVLAGTKLLPLAILSLYAGTSPLELPPRVSAWFGTLAVFAMLIQVGIWVDRAIRLLLLAHQTKNQDADGSRVTTLRVVVVMTRIVMFSVILLMALDNVPGLDITTLVAGLGVGGIAVALALQNVLGDLFASLSIVLDKPFAIGDFVIVGEHRGAVEYVGLKTTRIRSLSGEQIVVSNGDLLGSRIRNYGRMTERRVAFKLAVTYDTPLEKLRRIPEMIREAIAEHDHARFDRSHFSNYGDFALDFESVFYVLSADYNVYMDIQQAINLRLYERFEVEGIEFAFPTQTLHIQGAAGAGTTAG